MRRFPSLFGFLAGGRGSWGTRAVGTLGYSALALSLLVLAGIVAASVWLSAANRAALEGVVRARAVLAAANAVETAIDQAETGQRGFLLTGKEAYLSPFEAARKALGPALAQLEQQAAADSALLASVRKLGAVVADKLIELNETLELARRGDRPGAFALIQTDRGQRDSDAIRSMTSQMQDAQRGVINNQVAAINQGGKALIAMDTAGLAGLVLLAAFITYGIRQHLREMRAAQVELEIANRSLEMSNDSLERTVQIRTADLVEANGEIQRFAYIVSHDLRAPLVNIMGFTSELEAAAAALAAFVADPKRGDVPAEVAGAANDDIPEAIRFIKASTAKMDRLIGAILRLSREGRRVLAPERLDMRQVLGSIAETLQHQARNQDADISIGNVPALTIDRLVAEQIFGNLLENALKYLKPGRPGVVKIEGRQLGSMAVYEVRDNGRGIAPRDHERIFELFRRAGDQTVAGEGIGLAHVRALVRRVGGTITCQSTLDEGSTFSVHLPVNPPPCKSLAA
jgi:signal transduction histidine kinase